MHARVHERLLDPAAVDRLDRLVRMLLDDREQVAQQAALGIGQLGAVDVRVCVVTGDPIDRRARRGGQRRAGPILARLGSRSVLLPGPAQPPGR
jgi:hypothetical protein